MNRTNRLKFLILFILLSALVFIGCNMEVDNSLTDNIDYKNDLIVHFFDVGQGDSIFIQFPNGETSLIDGGTRNSSAKLIGYLQDLNVDKIDYLIATHPHEDHIGGLPDVINNFEVGNIYMPGITANTVIFEDLLKAIKSKDLKITIGKGGDEILNIEELKYEILAPNDNEYSETNNFSIVTKLTFKENSFIFTGDAELESERDILKHGYNISSDVIKIGHHGGSTSTTEEFLDKVNPEYAIISCGANNTYGHPHRETIDKLKKHNINILRTDELGSITVSSDGESIQVISNNDLDDGSVNSNSDYYIGNKNTKVYHSSNCSQLPKEENRIIFNNKEEAEKNGFTPHDKCVR